MDPPAGLNGWCSGRCGVLADRAGPGEAAAHRPHPPTEIGPPCGRIFTPATETGTLPALFSNCDRIHDESRASGAASLRPTDPSLRARLAAEQKGCDEKPPLTGGHQARRRLGSAVAFRNISTIDALIGARMTRLRSDHPSVCIGHADIR